MKMLKDRNLFLLWGLFFFLIAVFIILVYQFYVIAFEPKKNLKTSTELIPVTSIYGFGRTAGDLFNKPHDVCVDSQGNFIVSDTRNGRVVRITPSGKLLKIYKDTALRRPLGVSASGSGRVYVADRFSQALVIFNSNGTVYKRLAVDSPLKPFCLNNKVYLATRSSIAVLSDQGDFLFHFGRYGREESEFAFPNGLCVTDSNIYVSDSNNLRVQCFTLRGELVWITGKPPESLDDTRRVFSLPAGITVDKKNRLYVVDAFSDSIVIIDSRTGKIIKRIGGERGTKDGEFNQPSGIDYVEDDLFVVADKYNDRIQMIRISVESEKKKNDKESRNPFMLLLIIALPLLALTLIIGLIRAYRRRREPENIDKL
ncbi:MAG: hypothetical protein N2440_01645 [Actinobacteria bacterium]|nr:hypothetical protein [Actinomycetota bacterium]